MLIFGFMILYPDCVHMNRGNHEDETINLDPHCGGFYEETIQKYGVEIGSKIYEQMLVLYTKLPLATVLENKVYIVHGGLSRVEEGTFRLLSTIENRP